jgi:hypothetical protein
MPCEWRICNDVVALSGHKWRHIHCFSLSCASAPPFALVFTPVPHCLENPSEVCIISQMLSKFMRWRAEVHSRHFPHFWRMLTLAYGSSMSLPGILKSKMGKVARGQPKSRRGCPERNGVVHSIHQLTSSLGFFLIFQCPFKRDKWTISLLNILFAAIHIFWIFHSCHW